MSAVEIQSICYILDNGIKGFKSEWFTDQKEHFDYIYSFVQKYGKVPDKLTFVDKFRDFKCFTVSDPISSLTERLKEEARYKKVIPAYNKAYELISAGKSDEACKMLVEKITEVEKELASGLPPVELTSPDVKRSLYKELKQGVTKFPTGRPELDNQFGGWTSRDYVIIFSRSGIGKSWASQFFAYNLVKEGYRVGYYSGEMSSVEVSLRLDTFHSHLSNSKMVNGELSEDEYGEIVDSFSKLPGKFFVITPEELGGGASVEDLKNFIENQRLDALFVDQISLMKRNPKLSTTEAIENLSNSLRILQATSNIPFFIVSQQNRKALVSEDGKEKNKDDLLATISQSDSLGQNATLAFYLNYNFDNKILTLNMVKSRRSKPEKFSYSWDIDKGLLRYIPVVDDDSDDDVNTDPEDYGDSESEPF